jgi:hypothetical protein
LLNNSIVLEDDPLLCTIKDGEGKTKNNSLSMSPLFTSFQATPMTIDNMPWLSLFPVT